MSQKLRPDDESRVLRKYLEDIARFPILAAERERELGRIIQSPDVPEEAKKEAVDELVRGNLRFVVSYAKRFHSPEVSFLDLINEGNLGLIQAARRFDAERGVKFITYAVWWVRQAIWHALSEQWGAIRLPHKQATLHSRVARSREALTLRLGREPTIQEIADEAGVTVADAKALLELVKSSESLSRTTTGGGDAFLDALPQDGDARWEVPDSEEDQTLEHTLEQTTFTAADEQLLRSESIKQTRSLLSHLPHMECAILCRRFGIPEDAGDGEYEPMTLQEIGDDLKLSRERIRQIEEQAKARIKRTMKRRALSAYLGDERYPRASTVDNLSETVVLKATSGSRPGAPETRVSANAGARASKRKKPETPIRAPLLRIGFFEAPDSSEQLGKEVPLAEDYVRKVRTLVEDEPASLRRKSELIAALGYLSRRLAAAGHVEAALAASQEAATISRALAGVEAEHVARK